MFISVCILAVVDIIVYEVSQGILIIKLTCIVIANTVWIRRCFLTDITKSFITSLFFTSFMALFDGVALMGLAVAMSGNTDSVSQNPYIYYLFCYVVKLIELVGIVNLSDFALKDNDLAIVLSNLIDNAIEATEEVIDPEKRVITLKMQVLPNEHLLYIENPTALHVVIKNNHVVSSKKDAMSHGYGLKNIATVLNQYDATYAIEWKAADYKFCFSAQILVSNGE